MPPPTITPLPVAELLVEGERWPVCVHVIDHPDARVLVDTGMTELRPEVADMDPRLVPLSEQAFDLAGIDVVVNTHLHFDHCGGNHLFAGRPIYVQRQELEDARTEDDYTIREWVDVDCSGLTPERPRADGGFMPGIGSGLGAPTQRLGAGMRLCLGCVAEPDVVRPDTVEHALRVFRVLIAEPGQDCVRPR